MHSFKELYVKQTLKYAITKRASELKKSKLLGWQPSSLNILCCINMNELPTNERVYAFKQAKIILK